MIGYRRSSNKLIVSTSWLSMCYSSKSSAGTWLLHFNSSLAKLRIYYSMCWLRSEKMNWLLIRVALRGHRGETTHSLVISFNGGPSLTGTAGAGRGHRVILPEPPNPAKTHLPSFQFKPRTIACSCNQISWWQLGARAEKCRWVEGCEAPRGFLTKASRPARLN